MSVQFIKSARRGKPVTWYIYAWRGGPLIRKVVCPRKPKLSAQDYADIAAKLIEGNAVNPDNLVALIREWCPVNPAKKGSPEWEALSAETKRVWRGHVDLIEARWGTKPLSVWSDPRMIAKVVKWRDERAATPRSADMGVDVLRALLKFGRLRGRVAINVADGIPNLYKGGDRAEIVWTAADIAAFEAAAIKEKRPWMIDGLRLAALTGLRRQDLVTLTWQQIGEFSIKKTALKRSGGKRRRATIPMTPELEALLVELRGRDRSEGVETVLVNSFGRPWSGDGFGGSFNRIRDKANVVHIDDEGNAKKKHLHDVRGTFCTLLLAECELTDREAADVMAWSPERVAGIRKVYVDDARVVVAIGERIAAKQFAKQRGGN